VTAPAQRHSVGDFGNTAIGVPNLVMTIPIPEKLTTLFTPAIRTDEQMSSLRAIE
jgi:hypothetical protein